jgi:hypothetical protein
MSTDLSSDHSPSQGSSSAQENGDPVVREYNQLRAFLLQQHHLEAFADVIPTMPINRFKAMKTSIEDSYSASTSAQTTLDSSGKRTSEGAYAAVWRKLLSTMDTSCPLSPFSPGVPWLTFESAGDYIGALSRDTKGGRPTVAIAISAMNFVLRKQNEIGKYILQNKNPALRLLTHKEGLSGTAMRLAETKSTQYPLIRNDPLSSDRTRQRDPHRGRVFRSLTDEELTAINLWWLLGKITDELNTRTSNSLSRKYEKYDRFDMARNRALFALSHFALTRSDDCRSKTSTLSHIGYLPIPKVFTKCADKGYIFFLLKDKSKGNKKGWTQFAGCVRHNDPLLCPFNAMAEYLILSYGKHGRRQFPDMSDRTIDWTEKVILFTDLQGNPVSYSRRKKTAPTFAWQYEEFRVMKKAVGIENLIKATHFRMWGSMYGQDRGGTEPEMEQLGRWSVKGDLKKTSVCRDFYLRNINMRAAFALADLLPGSTAETCYKIPRGRNIDVGNVSSLEHHPDFSKVFSPCNNFVIIFYMTYYRDHNHNIIFNMQVMKEIFPNVFDMYKEAYTRRFISETNERVMKTIIILVASWIQDAAVLLSLYPQLHSIEPYTILFEDEEVSSSFERIQQQVMAHVNNAETLIHSDRQLEREDCINAVNNMGSSLKAHMEITMENYHQLWIRQGQQFLNEGQRLLGQAARGVNDTTTLEPDNTAPRESEIPLLNAGPQQTTASLINPPTVDVSTKYCLQNKQGLHIVDYTTEWEAEVLPRIGAGLTSWWGENDCRRFRSQRKTLYDNLCSTTSGTDTILQTARKFEDHCRTIPNTTWSDIVAIMVQKKKENEVNIFDPEIMKEIIKKRKYLQTKEGREERKRQKLNATTDDSEE